MGFELEYKIDGRKVSKDAWLRHISDEAQTEAVKELEQRVTKLRCSVHGISPRIVQKTKHGGRFEFNISACCDQMLRRAQEVAIGR